MTDQFCSTCVHARANGGKCLGKRLDPLRCAGYQPAHTLPVRCADCEYTESCPVADPVGHCYPRR